MILAELLSVHGGARFLMAEFLHPIGYHVIRSHIMDRRGKQKSGGMHPNLTRHSKVD